MIYNTFPMIFVVWLQDCKQAQTKWLLLMRSNEAGKMDF